MPLTFDKLRQANARRCARWHPEGINSWSHADWMTATVGEVGEACEVLERVIFARCSGDRPLAPSELAIIAGARLGAVANSIKKLNRVRDGLVGNGSTTPAEIAASVHANALRAVAALRNIVETFEDAHPLALAAAMETEQPALELTDDERLALAKEIADSVIYLDLTAEAADIYTDHAVTVKFNEVSERNGFPERL